MPSQLAHCFSQSGNAQSTTNITYTDRENSRVDSNLVVLRLFFYVQNDLSVSDSSVLHLLHLSNQQQTLWPNHLSYNVRQSLGCQQEW